MFRQLFLIFLCFSLSLAIEYDLNGYILYCPCMGRFGNQAEQFLGVLSFANGLNRTLVLPPWVEYHQTSFKSVQIPFDRYFKVEPLAEYVKVITMEDFMSKLAPVIWPESERIVYCYSERPGPEKHSCNAKDGNPFGSFWDTFDVDFINSDFYGSLDFDTHDSSNNKAWNKRFPPNKHLVLAFIGAPGAFPARQDTLYLQKYIIWSKYINQVAQEFIDKEIGGKPFLAIHLRIGSDWANVCDLVGQTNNIFSSYQCLGYNNEHGDITTEMCLPRKKTILLQTKKLLKKTGARVLFVASDGDDMIFEFKEYLKNLNVFILKRTPVSPHVDLAIMGRAKYFIGSCVSTFTAFAKRERDTRGLPSNFWAFPTIKKRNNKQKENGKDEL